MAKSKGKTASQIVSESRQELVDQLIQKMKDGRFLMQIIRVHLVLKVLQKALLLSSEQKVQLQRVIIALTRIARLQRVIHIFAVKIIL